MPLLQARASASRLWFVTTRAPLCFQAGYFPVCPSVSCRRHGCAVMHTLAVLAGGGLLPYLARDLCCHTVPLVGHSSECASAAGAWQFGLGETAAAVRLSEVGGGRGPAKAGSSGWLRTPLRCGSVAVTAARVHTQQRDGSLGLTKHTGQLDSQPPTQSFLHTPAQLHATGQEG